MRPAKTQISLGMRPVWSESSLCAQWVAKDPSFLHVDSEDSDQTGGCPGWSESWLGHTHFVSFVMSGLIKIITSGYRKYINRRIYCCMFWRYLIRRRVIRGLSGKFVDTPWFHCFLYIFRTSFTYTVKLDLKTTSIKRPPVLLDHFQILPRVITISLTCIKRPPLFKDQRPLFWLKILLLRDHFFPQVCILCQNLF